jgi:hypothetical protein
MDIDKSLRPVAFWFLNHRLVDEELVRQIGEMDDKGFGGFILHARDGLRTAYLSEDWAHAVEVCVKEAEARGMEVWLYDENHYPSGPAGGLLPCRHPDRTMRSMALVAERRFKAGERITLEMPSGGFKMSVGWGQSPPAAEVPLPKNRKPLILLTSTATGETHDFSDALSGGRLSEPSPFTGEDCLLHAMVEISFAEVDTAVGHYQWPYYPDGYNEQLTDEFIAITHKWYHDRFGGYFGRTIKGIFSDNYSPNFGFLRRSVPWGLNFEERFKRETGEDIRRTLPGLFDGAAPGARRSRMVYWRFMGRAYMRSYYERITAYCSTVGLLSTGHLCLEDGMAEHARQIGDYFEVMRGFTLTAVDQLGPGRKGNDLRGGVADGEHLTGCVKNTASAALWNGSPRVMCESFGCAVGWGFDLAEIKRISGWLFGLGVDLFVPHGLYYSIAGHRKWECIPDHLHNPQWKHYRAWTDWIAWLADKSVGGIPLARVAVLYPIHALRAGLEVGVDSEADSLDASCYNHGVRANAVQRCFRWTLDALLRHNIDYQTIDEATLAKGSQEGAEIRVPLGGRREMLGLTALLLPCMDVIEPATHGMLERFAAAGGVLVCINDAPRELFAPSGGTLTDGNGFFDEARHFLATAALNTSVRCGKSLFGLRADTADGNAEAGRLLSDILHKRVPPSVTMVTPPTGVSQIITRSWRKDAKMFHYVFNASYEPLDAQISFRSTSPLFLWRSDDATQTLLDGNTFKGRIEPVSEILIVEAAVNARPTGRSAAGTCRSTPVPCSWSVVPDRLNVMPLRSWRSAFSSNKLTHAVQFKSEISPSQTVLLLDLSCPVGEMLSRDYLHSVDVNLNGSPVARFQPGRYLDHDIYEASIEGLIQPGENLLEVTQHSHLLEREWMMHPPLIVGDFAVKADDEDKTANWIGAPNRGIGIGDWTKQGYPYFAGEFAYSAELRVPLPKPGGKVLLDCGEIADSAELIVECVAKRCRITPPWRFDLTEFAGRKVRVQIRVANTPANLLTAERRPAGLLGPVSFVMMPT